MNASLCTLLAAIGAPACAEDQPLELTSLQVVTLVDQIEEAFGIQLGGRDITRANFRTRQSLAALLQSKGAV